MATKRKRKEKREDVIEEIHDNFIRNLEGLEVFVSQVAPVAQKYDEALIEKVQKVFRQVGKILGLPEGKIEEKKGEETLVELTKEQERQLIDVLRGLPHLTLPQVEVLYKSAFVMLISYFDFLMSDLIHYFYETYPESLANKDLSVSLSELKLCDNVTEAMDYIINREVDKVLYDNLKKQRKYLENYLKIDAKENIICWSRINEAMERRNIIVHNDSKINNRYLKNVNSSVIPGKTKGLRKGAKITVDKDYFTTVFNEILIAGIILSQCCWRKWRKDDVNNADSCLIKDMYDALTKERWTDAERLGLFSKECKVANKRNQLYLDINYCQSLKWQNKKDDLEQELRKFDVSTLSPIYILALCALKSDRQNFYKNVEKAIIVDKMQKGDFMEWPLFRELRNDPDYEQRIDTIFISIPQKEQETESENSH